MNTYSARSADVALRNAQIKVNGYSVYTYDIKDTNGEVLEGDSAYEINKSISDALRNAATGTNYETEDLKGFDKKEYAKMYFAFTGHNIPKVVKCVLKSSLMKYAYFFQIECVTGGHFCIPSAIAQLG